MNIAKSLFPFLAATALCLANASAKEETTVTPVNKISPQQAKEIADAGVRVLVHIAEARGNIRSKQYNLADQNLNQAQTLVNIIRAEEPTYRVKNRIWVAQKHLEYEDVNQVKPDLVPIYADIDFLAAYVPTAEAKAHLDKAKDSLNKGDKKTAQNEFRLAGQALTYKEIDLPVGKTDALITSAKTALAQKNYAQAEKDLKMAEQSVQVTENVIAAPANLTGSSTEAQPSQNKATEPSSNQKNMGSSSDQNAGSMNQNSGSMNQNQQNRQSGSSTQAPNQNK